MRDSKIEAIMDLLKCLLGEQWKTTRSVTAIGMVERVEQFKDEVYFLNDENEGVLANQNKGSHLYRQEENQGSWGWRHGNQGRKELMNRTWNKVVVRCPLRNL
ncbi:hypothetical protein HAX54_000933 [Datura stramonium]|uniref:Uncharacterized protein n=1 Tax=Datura stramonium TaxID=4076 RepID=A0ABS8WUX3_DATST|nr:hypothetical protein [Datura stramonium]